jgi:DNA primase
MARIPDSFIDELLARTDIVELIEQRIPLKRAGREYQARCPFHDERSPSFTVSPNKQFYHCFGCGAHGTALKFLMEYDRLAFMDAVEDLAQRAGMTIPQDHHHQRNTSEIEQAYETLQKAADFFQQQRASHERAIQYLRGRAIDDAMIQKFGIGYAPDRWDSLKLLLGQDAAQLKNLNQVGLLSTSDQSKTYDKFRDRIMFPIRDRRGRVIAFGGRVLDKDASPKYLNSPETSLFHKGRELYGLYEAKQHNSKLARLIVVEGYLDVISLFQYGITQAVATLGTATTKEHAELLFRNSADVYFCFDGDRAGRAAAWRAVESVLPRMRDGRQAFFLFLPDGEDPDSLIRQEGKHTFEQRLQTAMPLSEFFFNELGKDVQLAGLEGKARLAERSKPLLHVIPDGAFRDLMYQSLYERTGVRAHSSVSTSDASSVVEQTAPKIKLSRQHQVMATAKRSLVRSAIALLLQQPSLVRSLQAPYVFSILRQPGMPLFMELIELCRQRSEISTGGILEHFESREHHAALSKLALIEFPADPAQWQAEFIDAIEQLNKQTRQQRIDELMAKQSTQGYLTELEKSELREALADKTARQTMTQ